jgi:hypothetical protein
MTACQLSIILDTFIICDLWQAWCSIITFWISSINYRSLHQVLSRHRVWMHEVNHVSFGKRIKNAKAVSHL